MFELWETKHWVGAGVGLALAAGAGYGGWVWLSGVAEEIPPLGSDQVGQIKELATNYTSGLGQFGVKPDQINAENIRTRAALAAKSWVQLQALGIDCDNLSPVVAEDQPQGQTAEALAAKQASDMQSCLQNRKQVVGFIDFRYDVYRRIRDSVIVPDSPAWIGDEIVETWKDFESDTTDLRTYEVENIEVEVYPEWLDIAKDRKGISVHVTFDSKDITRNPRATEAESWEDGAWQVWMRMFPRHTMTLTVVEDQGRWKVFDQQGLDYPFLLANWESPNENALQNLPEQPKELAPLVPKHPTPINELEDVNNDQLAEALADIESVTNEYGDAGYAEQTDLPSLDGPPPVWGNHERLPPEEEPTPDV